MKQITRTFFATLFSLNAFFSTNALAEEELVIRIEKNISEVPKVAIVPFQNDNVLSSVIKDDLNISGQVSLDDFLPETPHSSSAINISTWQDVGVPYVVVGSVKSGNGGKMVSYELVNIDTSERMLGQTLTVPANQLRDAAHHIADEIYQALTGKKSDFSGKLAYVSQSGKGTATIYKLIVSNTDGSNAQSILSSNKPIRSLTWSKDGRQLAYVSYASGRPHIYIANVYGGGSRAVVQFKGTNGAPSFSPDGRKLLFSSSKSGNFDIYLKDLGSGNVRNLTNSRGTDTEPSFAPDGKSFVYVSDRSGSPQIYQYSFLTGQSRRLTLVGNYNAHPSFSADGTKLALIHNYRTAIMDLTSGAISQLGSSGNDESPSFSPNGDVIVYSTKRGGQDIITMVSANGKQRAELPSSARVRSPSWAPQAK